ncbi:hypothetical protein AMTR_s00433p00012150, partial [Amborella trichopoda]
SISTEALQEWGSVAVREVLFLMRRLGSVEYLIRMHKHFPLFSTTCFSPLQQSLVGTAASPCTYSRHVASPVSCSVQLFLSSTMSPPTSPTPPKPPPPPTSPSPLPKGKIPTEP